MSSASDTFMRTPPGRVYKNASRHFDGFCKNFLTQLYVESFDRDEAREYGIDLELDMRGM